MKILYTIASAVLLSIFLTPLSYAADSDNKSILRTGVFIPTSKHFNQRQRALLNESLRTEIQKYKGLSTQQKDVSEWLDNHKIPKISECLNQEECKKELIDALQIDSHLEAKPGRIGKTSVLVLKCYDLKSGKVIASASARARSQGGEEYLALVGPLVEEIFNTHERQKETTVGVESAIFQAWSPPPLKPWMPAAMGGVVAIGLGFSGYFYAKQSDAVNRYEDLLSKSVEDGGAVNGTELNALKDDADLWSKRKNMALGASGLALVSSGILALFTDWQGPRPQATLTPDGKGTGVNILFDF